MEGSLKDRLAEALQYPRVLIRNEMHMEDCVHGGFIDKRDPACRECEDQDTCGWLLSMDEVTDFKQAPLDKLVTALGFALESVQSLLQEPEHDPFCRCEVCAWHRQADDLYSEARCHPELGPPPQPDQFQSH